jgi:mono/diheme cytochrome c family protein
MKKSFYLLFSLMLFACSSEEKPANDLLKGKDKITKVEGKKLYFRNCTTCHGAKGDQGYSGAKDLTISTLSDAEVLNIISNGKNGMMPYKSILKTEEEREAVKDFVKTLRK